MSIGESTTAAAISGAMPLLAIHETSSSSPTSFGGIGLDNIIERVNSPIL
jgi:NaMN:DMB phosphoribosyltransferase